MSAIERLVKFRDLIIKAKNQHARLEALNARLNGVVSPGSNGGPRSDYDDITLRCLIKQKDALAARLRESELACLERCAEIELAIDSIAGDYAERYQEILRLYYIDALSWSQIADRTSFSLSQIYRYRKCALQEICCLLEAGSA